MFENIVIPILVLAALIVVHELGHFLVARWAGIYVEEFSVGFGPRILKYCPKNDPTAYSVGLIPLGGYVKMAGMEKSDSHPQGFNKKSLKKRIAVIAAGPLMNFLLAIVLFVFTFSVIGIPAVSNNPVIGEIIAGSPADQAGLRTGDRILEVEGARIDAWPEIAQNIQERTGQETHLLIERDGEVMQKELVPAAKPDTREGFIGVRQGLIWEKQEFLKAVELGFVRSFEFASLIVKGLVGLVAGGVSADDVAGPIGITQMLGEAAAGGSGFLLSFAAILSINFALINLLPIPALDGSRLVFLLFEGLRGKPIDPDKENFIHLIGFAFLLLIIILVTYQDLLRILTNNG